MTPDDPRVREVRSLLTTGTVGDPDAADDNLLVVGDSGHALKSLATIPEYADRYAGKVKLVYIDPPFNTGQTFTHYADQVEHSVWLTFMRDRIRDLKPLMAPDSSIWVHLDDVENHRMRCLLDEEFGAENFVAEVVWQRADSPRNDAAGFSTSQDVLLVYRKGAWKPNRMFRLAQSNTSRYKSRDGDPVPWRDGDATAPGASSHQGMVYAVQHPVTGRLIYPTAGRCWGLSQDQMLANMREYASYELRDLDDAAERARLCGVAQEAVRPHVRGIVLAEPLSDAAASARARYDRGDWPELVMLGLREKFQRKKHLVDEGRVPETLWTGTDVGGSLRGKNEIKSLFPDTHPFATPKPEALLQRVVHIASDPGDLVLDCFAGSGTTAAVAHKMGRRWVTVELLESTAQKFTIPRLTKVVGGEQGGISTKTERVATDELPEGMTAQDAQQFNTLLTRALKAVDGADPATVKALRAATRTREEKTVSWTGGGGFTTAQVGPSMYEVDDATGEVFLSPAATNGAWSTAVAGQLRFRRPAGPSAFVGERGKMRLAVVDGVVTTEVVDALLGQLEAGQVLTVVGKTILGDVAAHLAAAAPGSRVKRAPADLFPALTTR